MIKGGAKKVRRLYHDRILAGFAGGTADAFTLFERFEAKLDKHQGNLMRSAVELAKDWRTDRVLRRLEAMLAVADREHSLVITGLGDVLLNLAWSPDGRDIVIGVSQGAEDGVMIFFLQPGFCEGVWNRNHDFSSFIRADECIFEPRGKVCLGKSQFDLAKC